MSLVPKHLGAAPVASLQMLLSPHPGSCTGLAGPCLCSSPGQTLLSSHLSSVSEQCGVMTFFTPRRYNSASSLWPCHVPGCVLYLFKAPSNIAEAAFDSHANCWTYSSPRQAILSRQVAPCLGTTVCTAIVQSIRKHRRSHIPLPTSRSQGHAFEEDPEKHS